MITGPKENVNNSDNIEVNDQGWGYKYRELHYLKFKKEVTNETKILTTKRTSNIRKRGEDREGEETMS